MKNRTALKAGAGGGPAIFNALGFPNLASWPLALSFGTAVLLGTALLIGTASAPLVQAAEPAAASPPAQTNQAGMPNQTIVPSTAIVGTWRMIAIHSWKVNGPDRGKIDTTPYGPHPGGLITYTADGRMSVIETYDGRKALSADREAAPIEERAQAFSTMVAYAGSYTLKATANGTAVIHRAEVSAAPGPQKDQIRYVSFQGPNQVTLRTPPLPRNGVMEIHEMIWRRVTPAG